MADEQPLDSGSEASIVDRLAAQFAPEPAPEVAQEAEQPPVEQEVSADDEPVDEDQPAEVAEVEPSAPDTVEFEDDDGQKHKIPAKFKDAHLRWKDYTAKTQELAKLQTAAHDRIHYAEAREQVTQAVIGEVMELRALQAQSEQYKSLDWSRLYAADPGLAMQLRDQRDQLERQIQTKESEIRSKAAKAQEMTKQHGERQWALAVEATRARLGNVSDADDAAMLSQVREMGFTTEELQTRFADPRFLHLVLKAAKYDAQAKAKPALLQQVQKAPPVLKPGATKGQGAIEAERFKNDRQQLRKSGDVKDAGRLLARMMRQGEYKWQVLHKLALPLGTR